MDIFVARQPIFDLKDQVVGYELLYRPSAEATAAAVNGVTPERMATEVVLHAFLSIGITKITGGTAAFINFTREHLLDGLAELLTPDGIVVELLETIDGDEATIAACQRLRGLGYRLALDDYEPGNGKENLIPFAELIKVDVLNRPPEDIAQVARSLRHHGKRLLAERVETVEVHQLCKQLGYELFQGYYYSRPETLSRKELPVAQLAVMRLMNLVRDPDASDHRIIEVFRTDLSLSYKLLRIVNSASFGGRGIESIQHALLLVGRAELYRWLSLLFIASMAGKSGLDQELTRSAVMRARMCELLAEESGRRDSAGSLFLVGLFSRLDALLKAPMAEVVGKLDLSEEVTNALLDRTGPLAAPLVLVDAYETGEWDAVVQRAEELGIQPGAIPPMYLDALAWSAERLR